MNQGRYQDRCRRIETILPESARDLFFAGADWRRRFTEAFGPPVLRHHDPQRS
ncbi:MAG: hypothetical protein KJ621_05665 [Proteobacteria bacterium]|nr:hypothetical protein [Pseudomonadota bacterium]MBU1742538.1 hypothetical protein [Pseudomonadota bacterium]